MIRHFFVVLCTTLLSLTLSAQGVMRLSDGWKFAFGHAGDPAKDFGAGTEYFNYLTKAASIHNEGPYTPAFDDSAWQEVHVPHDWVTALPVDPLASHSHGYKTVGWKYPETSVGWYRLRLPADAFAFGRHYALRFDGIFRDANVWFNGIWMGGERSGYSVQVYDITPYIDWDGENLVCVRADATLEEGWFYEGSGIYRDAWLLEKGPVMVTEGGVVTHWEADELLVTTELRNASGAAFDGHVRQRLLDAEGRLVIEGAVPVKLAAGETGAFTGSFRMERPHFWDVTDPYLYTLETTIGDDTYRTPAGIRIAEWNATEGFILNGRKLTLHGVNLHQDHAGVGSAMPYGLIEWRIRQLQKIGVNAIRCSHNPATPALLEICDRLGVLVIDENRLMGVNAEQRRQLENMVRFGRQHPCVILWSVGNEEWGLENDPRGVAIVRDMQEYVRLLDPYHFTTAANAGGATLIEGLQVHGYNYIVQNKVDERHRQHPEWIIYGSEETTGCGTRGVYAEDPTGGKMVSLNRTQEPENVIERGWKYYAEHPWTGGVFFWTGFDYRGEPNPLKYPAVLSEFGLLDYCGFPKDDAYYLQSWWTDKPVLHVCPPVAGSLWVYSNCDEVSLTVDGRNLGRKPMPVNGHLTWSVPNASPRKIVATGYRNGKRIAREVIETPGPAAKIEVTVDLMNSAFAVINIRITDAKGRFVADACVPVTVTLEGEGRILGGGNGDPAWHGIEAADGAVFSVPTFNGLAQVLVEGPVEGAVLHIEAPDIANTAVPLR